VPVASVLDYLRYLVDPVKAGNQRTTFTLAVAADAAIHQMQLRNGVLVISKSDKAGLVPVAGKPCRGARQARQPPVGQLALHARGTSLSFSSTGATLPLATKG
jgi:hypothetical protein